MFQSLLKTGAIYRKKRNVETIDKRCEFCGRVLDLQTYDTNKYFGILGIPLVPLGARRIIDECVSCGHYLVDHEHNSADFQKATTAIIIYLALFFYLFSSYMIGRSRQVYLVNGLDRFYEVEINGEKQGLPPLSHKKIKIPEGDITVKSDGLLFTPLTISFRTPFFSRLFSSKKDFIINPDGTAVFLWEQTTYMTESWSKEVESAKMGKDPAYISSTERYEYKIHVGKVFWEFEKTDYSFTEFPEEITIESESYRYKDRLIQLSEYNPIFVLNELLLAGEIDSIIAWNRYQLAANPTDNRYLYFLTVFSPSEETISFLGSRLDERPVLVDWHRFYQALKDKLEPESNLLDEYTTYLAREPDNPSLQYLLARVIPDPKEAEEMFLRSITHESPCPYGYYALAYQEHSAGEPEKAWSYLEKALALKPEQLDFIQLEKEILWALGRYDDLLVKVDQEREVNPYDTDLLEEMICLCLKKGEKRKAWAMIEDHVRFFAEEEVDGAVLEDYLKAIYYYCAGAIRDYYQHLSSVDEEGYAFEISFSAGRLEETEAVLLERENATARDHLLLYIARKTQGQDKEALHSLQRAIELLNDNAEERYFAACLEGTVALLPDRIFRLSLPAVDKCILLTALGVKYPEYRRQFFTLADKLNYNPRFPHQFIKDIHNKKNRL